MDIPEAFVFDTAIGGKIERGSEPTLPGEDWALNLQICDLVSQSTDGPVEAVAALQVRFKSQSPRTVLLALSILESLMANCGSRFHHAVSHKPFMDILAALATRHDEVGHKVRTMLQTWVETFLDNPVQYYVIYNSVADLKRKGLHFPKVDLSSSVPITFKDDQESHDHPYHQIDISNRPQSDTQPQAQPQTSSQQAGDRSFSVPGQAQAPAPSSQRRSSSSTYVGGGAMGHGALLAAQGGGTQFTRAHSDMGPGAGGGARGSGSMQADSSLGVGRRHVSQPLVTAQRVVPTDQQLAKLRGDLLIVRGNVRMLTDLLAHMPAGEPPEANELVMDLYSTNRAMQQRVLELLHAVDHEELTAELLEINDKLLVGFAHVQQAREEALELNDDSEGTGLDRRWSSNHVQLMADSPAIVCDAPDSPALEASMSAMVLGSASASAAMDMPKAATWDLGYASGTGLRHGSINSATSEGSDVLFSFPDKKK